jgi:tape measure domain-containing protein
MAATELATAYLSLVPSMRGAQGAIARELASVDADGIGKGIGSKMGGGIAGTLKGLVGPALAGLAAVGFGGYIAEAARASDATDKFKSTMNFAGLDTSAIEAATKASKAYADQTVYDLPTIQATMAQLASNGVTNYTELTQAAGNLNAVAGGNAETFQSVSRTLTQSAGAGKLMTEDWNMLADAIPGASGPLQAAMKEAGAFEGNFKKAMENGEISSEEFQAAITKLGNTPIASEAAKSVTTFEGALGNLEATVNSGLMGALDAVKPAVTGAINGVATGIGAAFTYTGNALGGLKSLIVDGDFTGAMTAAFGVEEDSPAVGWLLQTHDVLTEGIPAIRDILLKGDFTGAMTKAFGVEEDSPAVDALFKIRETVQSVMGGIRDFITGFTFPPILDPDSMGFTGFAAIGATVRDVFGQIGAAVGPLLPSMLSLWMAVSPLGTVFAALQPSIGPLVGILGNLALTVGTSLVTAITGILPAIQTLQAVFIGLFTDVLATVLPVVVQLVGMFATTLASLIPIIVPIAIQIATLAATLLSQLAPIFMTLVSAVLPMVVSALGAIFAAIGPVIQIVAGILIPTIQALMPVVVTVFSVIVSLITSAMQIIQGIIQVVTGIISGNWAQVFQGLGNIVSGVFSFIVNLISGALGIIGSVVMAGLSLVGSVFMNVWNGVTSFLGGVWGNITNGVSGMIGNVVGFFSGLIGRITGAIGNAGSALFSTGQQIIQGLINGISGMMGAIGRAVLSIVPEAIRGPFEDLLGIHSPSRVFRAYGVNIGEGLILGLEDMYDPVAEATSLLASTPEVPAFASASAINGYSALAEPDTASYSGPLVQQTVMPRENMSEMTIADLSARNIVRALK